MGLHDICKNPYHKFDTNFDIEQVYDEKRDDYVLIGVCECGRMRVVYFRELKRLMNGGR